MLKDAVDRWTITDASELYEVPRWGKGYFSVNEHGHMQVHPTKDPALAIDLKELIDRLQLRGIDLPILIRFRGILQHRLGDIHDAFAQAINEHEYKGRYICVYPIKVNQQRQVVEEVLRLRQALRLRPRSGQQAGAAGRRGAWPTTTRRSSATASRTPSSSRWRCWPRRSAATSSRSSRNTPSWG